MPNERAPASYSTLIYAAPSRSEATVAITTIAAVSAIVIFQLTRVFFERYLTRNMPTIATTKVNDTTMLMIGGSSMYAAIGMIPATNVVVPHIIAA